MRKMDPWHTVPDEPKEEQDESAREEKPEDTKKKQWIGDAVEVVLDIVTEIVDAIT